MSQIEVDYLGEGATDEAMARKLIVVAGASPGRSFRKPSNAFGKDSVDRKLPGLNAGARYRESPILILRDLDRDALCAPDLVNKLLPNRHPNLLLRACVRTAESWLMADAVAYARFCGVRATAIPQSLEQEDLKPLIFGWIAKGDARNLTRFVRDQRRLGIPDWAILGAWHEAFIERHWDPRRAADGGRSPSLSRALNRLSAMAS